MYSRSWQVVLSMFQPYGGQMACMCLKWEFALPDQQELCNSTTFAGGESIYGKTFKVGVPDDVCRVQWLLLYSFGEHTSLCVGWVSSEVKVHKAGLGCYGKRRTQWQWQPILLHTRQGWRAEQQTHHIWKGKPACGVHILCPGCRLVDNFLNLYVLSALLPTVVLA